MTPSTTPKPTNWHTLTFGRSVLGFVHEGEQTVIYDVIGKPTGLSFNGLLSADEVREQIELNRKKK